MKKNYTILSLYYVLMALGLFVCKHFLNTPYDSSNFSKKFLSFMILLSLLVLYYGLKIGRVRFTFYVAMYKEYGPAGLIIPKGKQYSDNYKIMAVKQYINTDLSYLDIAVKYRIGSPETVRRWYLRYTKDKDLLDKKNFIGAIKRVSSENSKDH